MDSENVLPRADLPLGCSELSSENASDKESFDDVAFDEPQSGWERARQFVARNKGKLALGAAAASATLTFAMNPMEEVQTEVVDAAPVIGAGIVASEAMFVGGLVMMASSVGGKLGKNPLKLRERLPEICEKANESKMFKSGFWVNAAGAVGSAAVISVGVVTHMPPESYGVLGFAVADIGVTVAVRKAMLDGIKNNTQEEATEA